MAPEVLFSIGPLGITNSILFTYFALIVIVVLAWVCGRNLKVVPAGRSWQSFGEVVITTVLNLAENSVGRDKARLIFPLMGTLFCFIIVSNWLGLLPIIGPIYAVMKGPEGTENVPIFRAVNSDWSTTLALALVTFVITEFWAFRFRAKEHIKHFLLPPGLGQIELISEFVRILSLSVRLFGNLFAGEVLITVMTSLTFVVIPAIFLTLESLFGLIQALVFTLLCLVYFSLGTSSHGGEHAEDHAEAAAHH